MTDCKGMGQTTGNPVEVNAIVMPGDAPKITAADISAVMTGILTRGNDELRQMDSSDLEQYWHFRWDATKSAERNTYQFYDMLGLYASFCRRWEEMHGGICCVVERVRDKYLMPKIVEFVQSMAKATSASDADPEETLA